MGGQKGEFGKLLPEPWNITMPELALLAAPYLILSYLILHVSYLHAWPKCNFGFDWPNIPVFFQKY
jgi:hypothetical protein